MSDVNIRRLTGGAQITAVVDQQWGDTGKGKLVHLLASEADVCARGTGGGNAGHTRVLKGKRGINHLLPIGIVYDNEGKVSIMGNGMVIDLRGCLKEIEEHIADGGTCNNLMISRDAQALFPYHKAKDTSNKSQANGGIGSTGQGIGPCYADMTNRRGVVIGDLLRPDVLRKKFEKLLRDKIYSPEQLNVDEMMIYAREYGERLKPFERNTFAEMHRFVREGKRIVLEGAQGLLLSVQHGIPPYVTSSDCSVNGTAGGVGLSAGNVDLVLGIMKFPFMTRVGGGPFPSELGGITAQKHCAEEDDSMNCVHTAIYELEKCNIPYESREKDVPKYDHDHKKIMELMRSSNDFERGIGIRLAAGEFGATTGRPRRVGWTDAVLGEYAAAINGGLRGKLKLVLTCPDILSGIDKFSIVTGYKVGGVETKEFLRDNDWLTSAKPIVRNYEEYGNISGETDFTNLPGSLKESMTDLETKVGAPIGAVSTGAERDAIAIKLL